MLKSKSNADHALNAVTLWNHSRCVNSSVDTLEDEGWGHLIHAGGVGGYVSMCSGAAWINTWTQTVYISIQKLLLCSFPSLFLNFQEKRNKTPKGGDTLPLMISPLLKTKPHSSKWPWPATIKKTVFLSSFQINNSMALVSCIEQVPEKRNNIVYTACNFYFILF